MDGPENVAARIPSIDSRSTRKSGTQSALQRIGDVVNLGFIRRPPQNGDLVRDTLCEGALHNRGRGRFLFYLQGVLPCISISTIRGDLIQGDGRRSVYTAVGTF